MKTIIILIIGIITLELNAQNWYTINSNTTEDLNDIFFYSETEGYMVSQQGSIFKTTDAGENWETIYNNPNIKFNYVCAINVNNGDVKLMAFGVQDGQSTLVSTFPNQSFDNWSVESIGYFPKESYENLPNSINGLVCQNNNIYILDSNDNNLKKIESGSISILAENVDKFGIINQNILYVNPEYDILYYSSNGGSDFQVLESYPIEFGSNQSLYAKLYPFQNNLMLYCTYPGNMISSTNNGETWSTYSSNENYGEIISPNLFFGTYQNQLFIQQNLGELQPNFTMPEYIRKIHFINNQKGFVIGENGMVYKTTTGGLATEDIDQQSSSLNISPNPAGNTIYLQNPKNITISKIELYNTEGKKIKCFNKNTTEIDIQEVPKGAYILTLITYKGKESFKVIKK